MSEPVYENPIYPDLAMEVRHGRGERKERVVDMVSTDDPGTQQHAVQRNTAHEQHGDSGESKKNLSRVAGLFFVLLLAVIIGLVLNNFGLIQMKNNNLAKERDELRFSLDQLESRYNNVTEEKDQLRSSFDQLQTRYNQLMEHDTKRIICETHTFTFFGGLCYYISTENKNWDQSRQWCRDKQSDLMVINSKEKQDFVVSLRHEVWLGLTDREVEGNWTWVDGTHEPTTSEYWLPNQPDDSGGEDCVEFYIFQSARGWNDISCGANNRWICERVIN